MATARAPKEGQEPNNAENIRLQKTSTGTVHKQIGESQFYSKHGIKPIADTLDNSATDLESPIKMKNVRKLHEGSTKFPKLAECAHFHYDFTDFGAIQVSLSQENQENVYKQGEGELDFVFYLNVNSIEKTWIIRRSHENFKIFDKQLHKCIFDRKFSLLPDLRRNDRDIAEHERIPALRKLLALYLKRFSAIAGNMINCGPILSWLEMDNRGNRLMVTDESAINTPAVTAGHVTKRYNAQAPDEISLQVGDIISIIDMPPGDETSWWRGKREYEVGFFPCECVELISEKSIRQSIESKIPDTNPTRPVLRKRGKLISFLRAFFTTRPARAQLQRTGIVKQRIFGCDLGEHLLNSGLDVPSVLTNCTEVIEEHGIVDGIYRLSGVASNIQKLRNDFDEEKEPNLTDEIYLQDIHSISSLLKAYFRELPNPLLTYQLYEKFSEAVQVEESKLLNIHDVIQQLPPPHYRTAEFLFKHLQRVSKHGRQTGMHCKNLAIVWAPNLMRSKELETMCNTAMLQGVGLQAIVTEFLIQYADIIFSDKLQNIPTDGSVGRRARPKSLAISTPTKLLSLEEAREQMLSGPSNGSPKQKFIEVGGGPSNLPKEYHTVIDLPGKKKRKDRKKSLPEPPPDSTSLTSSSGVERGGSGWRNIFSRKKQDSVKSNSSEARDAELSHHRKLRTVRSADSLLSAAKSSHNDRNSDPFDGKTSGISKSVKDEDFPVVKPKALTYEQASKKKYKSSRRTRSHDLAHSESDLSEHDGDSVSMDTEIVPRPSSATAELTGHGQRSDLVSELEYTLSTKSNAKKYKSSKDSNKKNKQRSSSAGQPIEGIPIPMLTDDQEHFFSSKPIYNDEKNVPDIPPRQQHYHSHPLPPPPSPSLKDRLVQALTPTSPRKKIKGPAPSPPSSPPPKIQILPRAPSPSNSPPMMQRLPDQSIVTNKKSISSKTKSHSRTSSVESTDISHGGVSNQPHSKLELLTGKQEPAYMDHQQQQQQDQDDLQQSQMIQLSPIEEALNSDISTTPDVEPQGLMHRLKNNALQEIQIQGTEGAEAEMASVGGLTDEEVFNDNYTVITPDCEIEFDSRKDALANLDIIRTGFSNRVDFGSSNGSNIHQSGEYGENNDYYGNIQSDTSGVTDNTLCNTDMSMSLDSLLKQVVGMDNYQSEFGSNASFKTFGKTAAPPPLSYTNEHMTTSLIMTTPDDDTSITKVLQYEHSSNTQLSPQDEQSYTEFSTDKINKSPVPKARSSKSKTKHKKHRKKGSNELCIESTDSYGDETDKCVTPTSSVLLETDIDALSDTTETKTSFDIDSSYSISSSYHHHNAGNPALTPQSEDDDRDERRNYIAPLPGDIKMMSQYPDLIAPNILSQIDLQETEVQYVDPHDSTHHLDDSYNDRDAYYPDNNESVDVIANNNVISDITSNVGIPEMSTISQHYYQEQHPQQQHWPDLMPVHGNHHVVMKSEPGHIVIRKPLGETNEGSQFIPVKMRVVTPPKQFAYSAVLASDVGDNSNILFEDKNESQSDDGETAIDTPSDEFPPPPPSLVQETKQQNDGYMADRSTSTSPTTTDKDQFQVKLKAVSQPLTITESEKGVVDMTISPPMSTKTPDSDNAMVTSSVESDILLDSMNKSAMSIDDKDLLNSLEDVVSTSSKVATTPDGAESEMVFQMDDIRSKSNDSLHIRSKSDDSLHNVSMSSDDLEAIKQEEGDKTTEKDNEFIIENTESQIGYFFTYNDKMEHHEEQTSNGYLANDVPLSSDNMNPSDILPDLTVDTSEKESNATQSNSMPVVGAISILPQLNTVKNQEDDDLEKKSSPVRRKKSVKELLSRFEFATNSPPSDGESKVKPPPVFQKPQIVRLHSLNKSEELDDEQVDRTDIINTTKSFDQDDRNLMSKSCPEATRLLSLSPRSINIDTNDDEQLQSLPVSEESVTDIEPFESNLRRRDRPSVRNKIKQFESSESLTSDSERAKSVSPGRKYSQSGVLPVETGSKSSSPKERAFSPVPPAKPVIIHERKSSISDIPQSIVSIKPNTTIVGDTPFKRDSAYPAAQKSQFSPRFSVHEQPIEPSYQPEPMVLKRSSFHMRSASSGMSTSFKNDVNSPDIAVNKPQSLVERKRRFESSDKQDSTESIYDSGSVVKSAATDQDDFSSNSNQKFDTEASEQIQHSRGSTLDRSEHKGNSAKSKLEYGSHKSDNMSQSVPNTLDFSPPQHHSMTIASSYDTVAQEDDSSFGISMVKPSQLFSRRSKRSGEPPPVPPHSNAISRSMKNEANNDDNVIRASFSDRRKLFESSTDSGISTSGYGSLKRYGDGHSTKSKPELPSSSIKGSDNGEIYGSDNDNYRSNSVRNNSSLGRKTVHIDTGNDYVTKARNFGQKMVVIESKDSGSSSADIGTSLQTEVQKENVKPPIVFNQSYETEKDSSQNERSGTVKDLWRKFEQQNS